MLGLRGLGPAVHAKGERGRGHSPEDGMLQRKKMLKNIMIGACTENV